MNFTSLIYVRILDDINDMKMVRGVAEITDLFRAWWKRRVPDTG